MTDRLATGIPPLDRKLEGGLTPGSLVALKAPPASQSEQFIRDLAAERQTLLVTTRRPRNAVERSLRRRGLQPDTVAVREVDRENPTGFILSCARALEERTALVIDPLDPLEDLPERKYVDFLARLQTAIVDRESVAVFHCLEGQTVPGHRSTTEYVSDTVFELSTDVSGDAIENRLVVPKFRAGHPFEEVLKLELRNRVAVDTSRDIG